MSWYYVTHMLKNEMPYLLLALWNYPIKKNLVILNFDLFIDTPKPLLYSPIFIPSLSSSNDYSSKKN